jgi:hypothetical protein
MSKSMKPVARVPKPATEEEKNVQIARFLTQKREQYFSLILSAVIRSGRNTNLKECIDASFEGADYVIEKMFPIPNPETKEGE